MTVKEFEDHLKQNKGESEYILIQMKRSIEHFERLYSYVKLYLYLKFMLFEGEEDTEDILELADISTEKIAELKAQGLEFKERSGTCGSISSAVTKKLLLLISLQNALDFKFNTYETADITTLTELTQKIMEHKKRDDI